MQYRYEQSGRQLGQERHNSILAEAAFHLRNALVVLAMVRDGLVLPAFDCTAHMVELQTLAARYADRTPDLADLCLIRMSDSIPGCR